MSVPTLTDDRSRNNALLENQTKYIMFKKTKYHLENSRKAMAYLNSLKNKKWTLEDMIAQLRRTTPDEFPLNARTPRLHVLPAHGGCTGGKIDLSQLIPVDEDKEFIGKLKSLLKGA